MREIAVRAQELKQELVRAVDEDTEAFERMMEAFRSGEGVQQAIEGAAASPVSVLRRCPEIAALAGEVAAKGLQASLSDGGVAASCARAAAEGAYYNVLINARQLEDAVRAAGLAGEARELLDRTTAISDDVARRIRAGLESAPGGGS
jgi:glutamate formiminotransferase/formiminotetrahydrofolate cyclodeaminase